MLAGVYSVLSFLFGVVLGSFGNVLILRLPAGRSIGGRSACHHCKKTLGIPELIPVISFIVLRGRCSGCHRAIAWQYPLVELMSGVIFLYAFAHAFPSIPLSLGLSIALWLLLLIAVTDLRSGLIPDALSIPFVAVSTLTASLTTPWQPIIFSALLCGGFFAAQWILSRGRFVGSGDILLGIGIGALLADVHLSILSLLIAYIAGAFVASILLLTGRVTRRSRIPFGPFLALGCALSFLWGLPLLAWAGLLYMPYMR